MLLKVEGGRALRGTLQVPADKSITHRALLLASLTSGPSTIRARAPGADNLSTAQALRELGVRVERRGDVFTVEGRPHVGGRALDCGNSGTTMRLLAGLLAGLGVEATLTGDASLRGRPMGRVCEPLRRMGARIQGVREGARETAPLVVGVGELRDGDEALSVASAQVKSALLLCGLAAGRGVRVREPHASRDHTERLLEACGARLSRQAGAVVLEPGAALRPLDVTVPGDFSSAAFVLAAAALVPGSQVTVRDVGVNATRTGLLEVLEELRARVRVSEWREDGGEPVAALSVEPVELDARQAGDQPTVVAGALVPRLVDELVVLGAVAARARGTLVVREARELRVKESDRIAELTRVLAAFGVRCEARDDGFAIAGPQALRAARVDVGSDHRIALTAAVLAMAAEGTSELDGFEVAAVSYPSFIEDLGGLGAGLAAVGVG